MTGDYGYERGKGRVINAGSSEGVNEKKIPNGAGFTVTLGCAMGIRNTSVYSVLLEKKNPEAS